MTEYDICDKLREHPVAFIRCDCMRCEAADEVDRLRHEIDLKGSRLDDALNEIERLRLIGDDLVTAIRDHRLTNREIVAWEEARRG